MFKIITFLDNEQKLNLPASTYRCHFSGGVEHSPTLTKEASSSCNQGAEQEAGMAKETTFWVSQQIKTIKCKML